MAQCNCCFVLPIDDIVINVDGTQKLYVTYTCEDLCLCFLGNNILHVLDAMGLPVGDVTVLDCYYDIDLEQWIITVSDDVIMSLSYTILSVSR